MDKSEEWRRHFDDWQRSRNPADDDVGDAYPWVRNRQAPFTPCRRALPMLNLALISSAGAYIDGTEPFDTDAPVETMRFREIPTEIEAEDLKFTARGYDPTA